MPQLAVRLVARQLEWPGPHDAARQVAAEGGPPLPHVLDLVRLLAGVIVRRQFCLERGVGDLQVEPVAEVLQLGDGKLLHLVGGVAGLEVRTERPALDRVRQNHSWLADVLLRGLERRVDLAVVVPATGQAAQLVVGQMRDHRAQPRVGAEEVLPDVGTGLDGVGLGLAVRGGVHLVDQHAVGVLGQQRVPVAAPDHLDNVPAGAAELRLEFLDDLAVAPDRAVQPLQVAVDHEGKVVEFLPGGHADRAEHLGLVGLAVAEEPPDMRAAGVPDLPGQQVPVEPGLIDRVDGAKPHRHGREFPEVRHQPGVRIGGEAAARVRQFLAKPVELIFCQAALQEGPGVDAGSRVTLDENLVARLVILAAEEMVEADLVEAGRRGVGGDVPADPEARPVGPRHHDGGVPANVGADPPLGVLVTGEPRLPLGRDGVDVVRAAQARHADLLLPGPFQQPEHDVPGAGPAPAADDAVEGLNPFPGLVRVDIRQLSGQTVADNGEALASGGHGVFLAFHGSRLRPAAALSGFSRQPCRVVSCSYFPSSYAPAPDASLPAGNRRSGPGGWRRWRTFCPVRRAAGQNAALAGMLPPVNVGTPGPCRRGCSSG